MNRKKIAIFGEENIEPSAIQQMYEAMSLPISEFGALMPDAHTGYGLPIGGVLATKNTIIPYAVGVDIGCSMFLSIFDVTSKEMKGKNELLLKTLNHQTKFGMKEVHENKYDHEIFSRSLFNEIKILKPLLGKAITQLGTSGGGNHFVEFGIVNINPNSDGLEQGEFMALLSHSGSRGLGSNIAQYYSRLASLINNSKTTKNLSWLDMDSQEGIEYWHCMNLAIDYAQACHENIHKRIAKELGLKSLKTIFNSHNLATKETIESHEFIVHRKGATPAHLNQFGIIPGSMTTPGYIVKGRGFKDSINSASHGAGRKLSRTKSKQELSIKEMKTELKLKGVKLIGGGIDESPFAYKDINQVMSFQSEMVDIVGSFTPKIVRME